MKQHLLIITLFLSSLLTACASAPPVINLTDVHQLEGLSAGENTQPSSAPSPSPDQTEGVGSIRAKALTDTALSLGAQGGLAWASKKINARIQKEAWYLDTIYNFNGMMLSHGVLPPILAEGDNSLNLADANTIRIADRSYKIIAQARFATTPPSWHDYIHMDYKEPEVPHKVLLPATRTEKKIWKKAINLGWEKGVLQAFSIYQQNLARLKRDYQGMILYRKLLQAKMVSPPFVARTELGVTGDGDDMRVNDQVLRITELPKLQTDSNQWKAIVVQP